MGWKAYRLVYQAKSPIHIGWHTLGYIKLTRYYITGKAMWGAMTANITRAGQNTEPDIYKVWGDLLRKDIRISYFYPAIDTNIPLLPKYTDTGLEYGGYSASEFERLFVKSFGQTAVVPQSNTAEDETLHESEYISPCVEIKGRQQQVFFIGYVFIKEGANYKGDVVDIQKIKQPISEIFVGGDRKYGWGRLSLDEEKTGDGKVADGKAFEHALAIDDTELKITIEKDNPIPAHLSLNSNIKMKGDIEPLVGMEFENNKGFGQKVSKAEICWMPGSIFLNEEEKPPTFRIGEYGILE